MKQPPKTQVPASACADTCIGLRMTLVYAKRLNEQICSGKASSRSWSEKKWTGMSYSEFYLPVNQCLSKVSLIFTGKLIVIRYKTAQISGQDTFFVNFIHVCLMISSFVYKSKRFIKILAKIFLYWPTTFGNYHYLCIRFIQCNNGWHLKMPNGLFVGLKRTECLS